MSKENERPDRCIRCDLSSSATCDCCLGNVECVIFRFTVKDLVLCGACHAMFTMILFKTMQRGVKQHIMESKGFRPAPPGYQPEPDLHEIEMIGSDLWIKDKE